MPDRIDIRGDADIVGIADDVPNGCVVLIRNRARARYIILQGVERECPGRAWSNIFRREIRNDGKRENSTNHLILHVSSSRNCS